MTTPVPMTEAQVNSLIRIALDWDMSPSDALNLMLAQNSPDDSPPIACLMAWCPWAAPGAMAANADEALMVQIAHLLIAHTAVQVSSLADVLMEDIEVQNVDDGEPAAPEAQNRLNWVEVLADFMFNNQTTRPGGFEAS